MSSQQTGQPAKPGKRSYDLDVKNERSHIALTIFESECDDSDSLIREQGRIEHHDNAVHMLSLIHI